MSDIKINKKSNLLEQILTIISFKMLKNLTLMCEFFEYTEILKVLL